MEGLRKLEVTKQASSIPNHWLPGSKLGVDLKGKIPKKNLKCLRFLWVAEGIGQKSAIFLCEDGG